MIKYDNLGKYKKLNEIVMIGSHDAGITSEGGAARTQRLDLFEQAKEGVRFFDLRISAFSTGHKINGIKEAELKAFHAADPLHVKQTKFMKVIDHNGQAIQRSKLIAGAQGMGLHEMLVDAKRFVTAYPTEFLILKFDKCTNWHIIAEMCRLVLDDKLHRTRGNINTMTLGELAGRVVVGFMEDGFNRLEPDDRDGIAKIRNLQKRRAGYESDFSGLQYWGSGGTAAWKEYANSFKIDENLKKQTKIYNAGLGGVKAKKGIPLFRKAKAASAPLSFDAMGMMYWTSTGTVRSIENRNNQMWNPENKARLLAFLEEAVPPNVMLWGFGSGATVKKFMPNIVMIDFADSEKCRAIFKINAITGTQLVAEAGGQ